MEHFWDTIETIGAGYGFSLFGARHLATLALFVGFAALSCKLYKEADEKKRAGLRKLFALLLLADEAFKQIGLQIGGNFDASYLPLHLCSINIFLIALHAWRPSEALDNFLYYICIPAATAALLFPTWTSLPAMNFMFLHSTSVHILLAVYPMMLFAAGDIRPSAKGDREEPAPAAHDGRAHLRGELSAGYELHVPHVRAGRQSAGVVPRPLWQPLDRLSRAARGGRRRYVPAGAAEEKTRDGGGKTAVLTKIKERQPLISGPAALFRAFCLDERAGFCYF